jgi:hypothetical protein
MESAKFVAIEAVAALWTTMLKRHGPAEFAERAMPQLVRWESRFGWTARGFGSVPGTRDDAGRRPRTPAPRP